MKLSNIYKFAFIILILPFLILSCKGPDGKFKLPGGDARKTPADPAKRIEKNLQEGKYVQCFGCRRPLSERDLESKFYEKGVSCHKCYHLSSKNDKERFAQRQLQIDLAEERGEIHMGLNAKQSK